jgi:hypothetical protein
MVGTPDEMLPDRGALAARQALAAAAGLRVFDARTTAWLVVQRLLEVVGMSALLLGIAFGSVLVGRWVWIVLGAGALLLALEGPTARLAGAEPRNWPTRWRLGLVAALMVAVVVVGILTRNSSTGTGSGSPLVGYGLLVTCYLVAPVVRWALSSRQGAGAAPWPDGAQAYAVLSALARVQWMHRVRLAQLTGMTLEQCDAWVGACASRGLVAQGASRGILTRHPEITAQGLARLTAWTDLLQQRAAGAQPWTDSTAPTSADVSSDRSSSDVT